MAHVRKQIRDAIGTRLTGLATTGSKVYPGRSLPLADDQSPPALCFYTFPDSPDFENGELYDGVCLPLRVLTVEIQGYYRGGSDDDLDQMAVEVEEAMYTDPTFGGLVQWTRLGDQDVGRDSDGARLEGVITMQFDVAYLAAEGSPQVVE